MKSQDRENNQRNGHDKRRFKARSRRIAPRFSEEHNENQPHHVERGQECGEKTKQKNRRVVFVGESEDCVLAEESAERRTTDQRQRADSERRERSVCSFPASAAHLPDVLLVMQHDDDRTGAEEEQRLEKRVREKVKHRRFTGSQTDGHHHVAELRQGGVGEDAFDVVLLRGDERGHDAVIAPIHAMTSQRRAADA